ncbi:MAG: miniconductance mechanosensitive channel MscM [Enterobacteriaceae bacterium]|nr:miniconductance mechanosensitive channel MscM [Enterobacteriaceae bacterium]
MRLIISLLLSLFIASSALAVPSLLNEEQLKQELKQVEGSKDPQDTEIAQALQNALTQINNTRQSKERSAEYQYVIDNNPKIINGLRSKIQTEGEDVPAPPPNQSLSSLEQQITLLKSQSAANKQELEQELDRIQKIGESINTLPQQQADIKSQLTEVNSRLQSLQASATTTKLTTAQLTLAQAETNAYRAKSHELELEQYSASYRQNIARLQAELLKKRDQRQEFQLQLLNEQLNFQRQQKTASTTEDINMKIKSVDAGGKLLQFFQQEMSTNDQISKDIDEQDKRIHEIKSQQTRVNDAIQNLRNRINTILEQSKLPYDTVVQGAEFRTQLFPIPDVKIQSVNQKIASAWNEKQTYQRQLEGLSQKIDKFSADFSTSDAQEQVYQLILNQRESSLKSLLSGYDNESLELEQLKASSKQLDSVVKEVQEAVHRYLFWIADVKPISLNYPALVVQDLTQLLSVNTFNQLGNAIHIMLTTRDTLFYLLGTLLLVIFSISSHRQYHAFLERSSSCIGKVTQDHFSLTLRTVFWSVVAALPLPMLWSAIGYGLKNVWDYPMATAIGIGVSETTPVLWVFMLSAVFAHPNGLFIAHFRWPEERVKRAMRFYRVSIFLIVPLMMALITFNNYYNSPDDYYNSIDNYVDFAATLGRLCFLMLCIALSVVTSSLKRAGIPLYMDKHGSGDNIINTVLWWILLCAPVLAAIASAFGYLQTAQALLARLETSVVIWFALLVVYHIICRWMLIQRRKIAFERAKQRRAEIIAQRSKNEEDTTSINSSGEGAIEIEEPVIDLDAISAQSLGLVRSLLTMAALISLILLWSELHSAFSFLGNIKLWDVTTNIDGKASSQAITLSAILIAILIIIITTQLVRNLPALLELALLQHLELSAGTGYAITTLTKYSITLIGGLVGFSLIGIEWSKLQWLVAAMGVGLGFGLQEIFANIISGLMLLFEKPIRIGDMVTIRGLTGSITKINTRATTLSDWDRKEIIVPNRAFITEQFINWSLSDTVTRIVLTVPVPVETDPAKATEILITAAQRCPLIIDNPMPEAYLVDLQQGIQIYELRAYAAEMGHRMPARHEMHQNILQEFRHHDITLPFPPFQARADIFGQEIRSATTNMSGRNPPRKPGDL